MRDVRFLLKAEYGRSHALVIGIDQYKNVSPLGYAVSDARAVYQKLVEDLDFSPDDVVLLVEKDATAHAIRQNFLRFVDQGRVGLDDRVFVFFAGHGSTTRGSRGEVGHLVPYDADLSDLSTLLRWDDLTRNSELIPAKHVLFVMDACYGGLAVTRSLSAGSTRFARDMLRRFSRQVLTAGKADETVADLGGPLPGHSVFTGHFLQGLAGGAATRDGLITASGLMAYVYNHVSQDVGSQQTPHYGHVEGDGDFIFKMPPLLQGASDEEQDLLFVVPYSSDDVQRSDLRSKVARTKQLLGEPDKAIELHDFVIGEVKSLLLATADDSFPVSSQFSEDELLDRLSRYEKAVRDLSVMEACIAYWASSNHRQIIRKALARSVDRLGGSAGMTIWLQLRFYPLVLQTYCAGVAAVSAGRYDTLGDIFLADISSEYGSRKCFIAVAEAVLDFSRSDLFKRIPEYSKKYTPMSEYLFKQLQPQLDDALFVGRGYEAAFDEFEVLLAIAVAHHRRLEGADVWGPIGRFGWKLRNGRSSPLSSVVSRIKSERSDWMPLQSGIFAGEFPEVLKSAEEYAALVSGLNWH